MIVRALIITLAAAFAVAPLCALPAGPCPMMEASADAPPACHDVGTTMQDPCCCDALATLRPTERVVDTSRLAASGDGLVLTLPESQPPLAAVTTRDLPYPCDRLALFRALLI